MVLFYAFPLVSLAIITVAVLHPYLASVAQYVAMRRVMVQAMSHHNAVVATTTIRRANKGAYLATLAGMASMWPMAPQWVGGFQHVSCAATSNPYSRPYSAALVRDAAKWVGPNTHDVERNLSLAGVAKRLSTVAS